MDFVKEVTNNGMIYNSIQMRINFMQTGSISFGKDYVLKKGNIQSIKDLKSLDDDQLKTIARLRMIQDSLVKNGLEQ